MFENDTDLARRIAKSISYLERHRRRYINEHLKEQGLRGSMFLAITYLNRNPGSSQDKLCSELLIDKGNVARMCRHLEELGYLYREQSATDRRQYQLYLTDSGKEQVAHIRKLFEQWRQIATQGMSEDDCRVLTELLVRMTDNISTM